MSIYCKCGRNHENHLNWLTNHLVSSDCYYCRGWGYTRKYKLGASIVFFCMYCYKTGLLPIPIREFYDE